MTFEQIRIFLVVSLQRNFTNASAELFISQSSVSKQIQKLEDELDTALFIRKKTGVELTEAGEILLASAEILLNEFGRLKKKIIPYTKNHKDTLFVLGEPTLATYGVQDLIEAYSSENDHFKVQYSERPFFEMPEIVSRQAADLLLVWEENVELHGGKMIRLLEDEAVLVVPKGHRLAKRGIIEACELKDERFSILHRTMMRSLTLEICNMGGFSPNICYEAYGTTSQLELIRQGKAIGFIMSGRAYSWPNPSISIVRVQNAIRRHIAAYFPEGPVSPEAKRLIGHLRNRMALQQYPLAKCV